MNSDNKVSFADEASLANLLKGIGKRVFVQYYEEFRQENVPISIFDCENFTEKSKQTSRSNARTIFKNGWEKRALQMVIDSEKTNHEIKARAKTLLVLYFGEELSLF